MEKAYILLAQQERISNNAAKKLIDSGRVFSHDKKIMIARALMRTTTNFKVLYPEKIEKIFEDENIIVINKPAFTVSENLEKKIGHPLLHRLDKDTTGILVFVKNENFQKKAINEFRKRKIYKEYICWVEGMISEPVEITLPILTIKGKKAHSRIDYKKGKEAITKVEPILAFKPKSKIKVVIDTGRTHQIRVHLKAINHPIVGDEEYGAKADKRVMLHHHKFKIFNYEFEAPEPIDFIRVEENENN